MIKQSIKLYPDYVHQSYIPPAKSNVNLPAKQGFKPLKYTESGAPRCLRAGCTPHTTEYAEAVNTWNNKFPHLLVGQKIFVKFHPQGLDHERIFTRLLPIDFSNVVLSKNNKEVQIIEVWNPTEDVFCRVSPDMCFPFK